METKELLPCVADTRTSGFAKEVCRSMVAMMDVDHSGKLGYEEFKTLWTDIRHWRVSQNFSAAVFGTSGLEGL